MTSCLPAGGVSLSCLLGEMGDQQRVGKDEAGAHLFGQNAGYGEQYSAGKG